MTIQYTDTHCHLDFTTFEEDLPTVVKNSQEQGLVRILNPGTDAKSSQTAITISQQFPQIYAAIGIHPNHIQKNEKETWRYLEELAIQPKVVAIGEIGLDYYRDITPRHQQTERLQIQLEFAALHNLPVIIHNREADIDLLPMLTEWYENLIQQESPLIKRPGVLHAFSSSPQTAEKVLALNFYLGICGVITFPKTTSLQGVVCSAPIERLLIETDSPFLSPQNQRGKRNEPANIPIIAQQIAHLRQQPLEIIAQNTTNNAAQLFEWGNE